MAKLNGLFKSLEINKSPHGTQAGKAVDIETQQMFTPIDGCEVRKFNYDEGTPSQSWFDIHLPVTKGSAFLRCVHGAPPKIGKYKAGEIIGNPYPTVKINGKITHASHWHVALNVDGVWYNFLEYYNRNTELFWWTATGKHDTWTNWATYADRQLNLPITEPIEVPRKMQSYPANLLIHTHNTEELNIRKAPSTKSGVVGKLPPKSSLKASELVLDAELVSGVSTWYRIEFKGIVGYISGAFVDDVKQVTFDEEKKKYEDQISALETKLLETNQEVTRLVELVEPLQGQIATLSAANETLTTKVENQAAELTKFNEFKRSVFYALFLIFNRKR